MGCSNLWNLLTCRKYPVPGNGSNGTYGNSTALAFEGAGSRLDVAVQAGVVGLLVAAGFAVL